MAAQIVAQMAAGFAVIATRRPLQRATVTSVVSYAGIGMLLVCCPRMDAGVSGRPAAAGTRAHAAGEGRRGSGRTHHGSFGTMTLIFATMKDMQRTQWWPIA